jgi:outer membrane lipoprotein-sorting protein
LVLFLSAAIKASGNDIFSYIPYSCASWNQKTVSVLSGVETNIMDQQVMFKGNKMRMDGVITVKEGKVINQIVIITDKVMYVINKDEKSGIKFSMDSAMNPEKSRIEAAKYRKDAKKTGSETVNGILCGIYYYSFSVDGNNGDGEKIEIKEWRAIDGFVIKTVSVVKGTEVTTTILNIKKEPVLSDGFFDVPADIKVLDMDNLMKGTETDKDTIYTNSPGNTGSGSVDATIE